MRPVASRSTLRTGCLHADLELAHIFRGQISAEQYKKWFKSDYPGLGERIEIPKDATFFGTLVLTNGNEVIVLPFYEWRNEYRPFGLDWRRFGEMESEAEIEVRGQLPEIQQFLLESFQGS